MDCPTEEALIRTRLTTMAEVVSMAEPSEWVAPKPLASNAALIEVMSISPGNELRNGAD